jgi:hypothetical protein
VTVLKIELSYDPSGDLGALGESWITTDAQGWSKLPFSKPMFGA